MDIDFALESWRLDLRAQRKRDQTIETYLLAGNQLKKFLISEGRPTEVTEITRHDLRAFVLHFIETRSPETAKQRFGSLRVFFGWLTAEGEIDENPIAGLKAPKVELKKVETVDPRHYKILLDSCGPDFKGKRDAAIFKLLWDTGMRRGELTSIRVDRVFMRGDRLYVEGKTGFREVPYGPDAAVALNRYIRARESHPHASSEMLWLGERGPLTDRGIYQMISKKGAALGLPNLYPHLFRHTATDRFLSLGMNEGDVVQILGWSPGSRSMLDRYSRVHANERAFANYRKLIG